MNAGAYRQKIEIQKSTPTKDVDGVDKDVWVKERSPYAYANALSGAEFWAAAQVNEQETVVFEIRWHPWASSIDPEKNRIVWNGWSYDISFVDDVMNRHETVKIKCLRGKRV
ncbi:MAG: phage head closure protein [Atopobiaceae bacterium]|jgi:SPP1 family predicted phage head-tail adaptor|nr:phage head closure protein [Atopobiaceae bacterium]